MDIMTLLITEDILVRLALVKSIDDFRYFNSTLLVVKLGHIGVE